MDAVKEEKVGVWMSRKKCWHHEAVRSLGLFHNSSVLHRSRSPVSSKRTSRDKRHNCFSSGQALKG
jgi:hypothetical protein